MSQKQHHVFRLGEFFCGPGGLAFGAGNASIENADTIYAIRHTWATDYDRDSCDTYRRNICPESPQTVNGLSCYRQ